MTQAKSRFRTIEQYAALDPSDLPEGNYELVNGEIIELPAESDPNVEIAMFLTVMLAQFVPSRLIRRGTEIFVSSRTVTSRYPDLMVLTEEGRAAIKGATRSAITHEMPAPALVIEIVSPGEPGDKKITIATMLINRRSTPHGAFLSSGRLTRSDRSSSC